MLGKKPVPPPVGSSRPAAAQPAPAAAAQPTGWILQVLTNDYVVTGYLPPIDMPLVGWLNVPTQVMISLNKAQVTALDPHSPLSTEIQSEVIVPKSAIIGLIPRDEKSVRAASTQMLPRLERAIIYAGPFVLRACFRLAGEMPLRNLFGGTPGDMLVVSDADIHSVRADANFQPYKAPALILSKSRVQLYYPA
jgi:hypothetical protein